MKQATKRHVVPRRCFRAASAEGDGRTCAPPYVRSNSARDAESAEVRRRPLPCAPSPPANPTGAGRSRRPGRTQARPNPAGSFRAGPSRPTDSELRPAGGGANRPLTVVRGLGWPEAAGRGGGFRPPAASNDRSGFRPPAASVACLQRPYDPALNGAAPWPCSGVGQRSPQCPARGGGGYALTDW